MLRSLLRSRLSLLTSSAVLLSTISASAIAAEFKLVRNDHGVTVNLNGKLLTRFYERSGAKPILWPLIGPTGSEMTRGYPMQPAGEFEKEDHIHHRSLWFDHGDVNGVSFWAETEGHGTIVHRGYLKIQSGPQGELVTHNDWVAPSGDTVFCRDTRRYRFSVQGDQSLIDFDVTVSAGERPVFFGDTKEGSFGIRVAGSMRTERDGGGTIINSEGLVNKEAWGKRAAWVDYSGPVDGQIVGIAILNHPASFRFPTYWHVRTYGLFAANPFGLHHFTGAKGQPGRLELAPGDSFALHYRVILHRGTADVARIAESYRRYAAAKCEVLPPAAASR